MGNHLERVALIATLGFVIMSFWATMTRIGELNLNINRMKDDIYQMSRVVERQDSTIRVQAKQIDSLLQVHPWRTTPRK